MSLWLLTYISLFIKGFPMAKTNTADMASLFQQDIASISQRSGVRQTVGDIANTISQSAKAVGDVVELARYELIDMKHESRQRLMEKYK
jgi:hypothetical protein